MTLHQYAFVLDNFFVLFSSKDLIILKYFFLHYMHKIEQSILFTLSESFVTKTCKMMHRFRQHFRPHSNYVLQIHRSPCIKLHYNIFFRISFSGIFQNNIFICQKICRWIIYIFPLKPTSAYFFKCMVDTYKKCTHVQDFLKLIHFEKVTLSNFFRSLNQHMSFHAQIFLF